MGLNLINLSPENIGSTTLIYFSYIQKAFHLCEWWLSLFMCDMFNQHDVLLFHFLGVTFSYWLVFFMFSFINWVLKFSGIQHQPNITPSFFKEKLVNFHSGRKRRIKEASLIFLSFFLTTVYKGTFSVDYFNFWRYSFKYLLLLELTIVAKVYCFLCQTAFFFL